MMSLMTNDLPDLPLVCTFEDVEFIDLRRVNLMEDIEGLEDLEDCPVVDESLLMTGKHSDKDFHYALHTDGTRKKCTPATSKVHRVQPYRSKTRSNPYDHQRARFALRTRGFRIRNNRVLSPVTEEEATDIQDEPGKDMLLEAASGDHTLPPNQTRWCSWDWMARLKVWGTTCLNLQEKNE